jgi:LPS sulfotransferase NodH
MSDFHTQKFVIITMARTGSNALADVLTQHADIHCDYEIYHPKQIFTDGVFPGLPPVRDDDPVGFLDTVMDWNAERLPQKKIYGFKLFTNHCAPVLDAVMDDPGWRKIILRRRNTLDQFISREIARQSGAWSSSYRQKGAGKVQVDVKAFLAFHRATVSTFGSLEARLRRSGQTPLLLDYEDIAAARFDKVFDFLGVQAAPGAAPILTKQNARRTADKVSNPLMLRWWLRLRGLGALWVD